MTEKSKQYYRYIYLMQKTDKGWFVQIQFDQQFKGDVEEIKQSMLIITRHENRIGKTVMIRFCKQLINLEGYFPLTQEFEDLHKLFLSRILNKPKNYV